MFIDKRVFKIPTYEEALAICQRNPVFYETKHKVMGYDVSVFNYRLATFDDFRKDDAFEMRGLTFVFNSDGTLYKRFLGLHKFFNVNETEITQAHLIKDYEVINVSDKLDGSMIHSLSYLTVKSYQRPRTPLTVSR